jgi:hypothetical protein
MKEPASEKELICTMPLLLRRAVHNHGRVVLFIDGAEHLDAEPDEAELSWLPSPLPSGVRVVLSTTSSSSYHEVLRKRGSQFQLVPPLALEYRQELLDQRIQRIKVHTDKPQHERRVYFPTELREALLLKAGAESCQWLMSACDELVGYQGVRRGRKREAAEGESGGEGGGGNATDVTAEMAEVTAEMAAQIEAMPEDIDSLVQVQYSTLHIHALLLMLYIDSLVQVQYSTLHMHCY